MSDDISAPQEDDLNEDPKDVLIRNLRRHIERLERELQRMRTDESWRDNPDRMGR